MLAIITIVVIILVVFISIPIPVSIFILLFRFLDFFYHLTFSWSKNKFFLNLEFYYL